MPSVFLSYSREDRAFAGKIVKELENGGVSVWWDALLEGGERFSETTEAALDGADVVVVLWSKISVKSHWVHDEATRGRDRGRLVPATIDGTPPPLGFGQFQALDLSQWKGKSGATEIAALIRAIGIAAGNMEPARKGEGPKKGPNRRKMLIGGGAAIVAAGTGLAAWRYGLYAPQGEGNSVAVLPFRNLSGDPEQDYFAEGIAEEIRNTLARHPLLKVIARTTSNVFRGREEPLQDVAAQLEVAHMLDGSVRREGDRVRINVELIDGRSGTARWAETYDRPFGQILRTQAEIAQELLNLLNAQVSGLGVADELHRSGGTSDPAAFDAFIRGRAEFDRFNFAGLSAAKQHFARARSIDPNYAAAYAGNARALANLEGEPEARGMRGLMPDALALARRGHELAPDSAFVLIVLAATLAGNLRFGEALPYYEKAYAVSPRHLDVPMLYGLSQMYLGKMDIAAQAIERALSVDRLNPRVWFGKVWLEHWSGNQDEALRLVEKIWSDYPAFGSQDDANYFRFACNLAAGRLDAARQAAQAVEDPWEREWELAMVALFQNDDAPAQAWLAKLHRSGIDSANEMNNRIELLAKMGRLNEAMDALETEYERFNPYLVRLSIEPFYRPLDALPRFKALQRRIGLIT